LDSEVHVGDLAGCAEAERSVERRGVGDAIKVPSALTSNAIVRVYRQISILLERRIYVPYREPLNIKKKKNNQHAS
jgi:hypothetical protein